MKRNKRVCCFSDSHGLHNNIKIPPCDILIFAGDFDIHSLSDLEHANSWFGKQKAKYKIFVAGNHDTYFEKIPVFSIKDIFNNVIYLQDEMIEIKGLKIYGSPYSPKFGEWSFSYKRCSLEAKNIWSKIPENLDILVTHGPSYGVLDRNLQDERCGCEILQKEIIIKKPKRHVFGHLHLFGGQSITQCNINFYNVSVLDEDYKLVNPVTIINI